MWMRERASDAGLPKSDSSPCPSPRRTEERATRRLGSTSCGQSSGSAGERRPIISVALHVSLAGAAGEKGHASLRLAGFVGRLAGGGVAAGSLAVEAAASVAG